MKNQAENNNHEQREREVFDFFNGITSETDSIFLKNNDNTDVIPLRIQMVVVFSLIDIFASYWYEYRGEEKGQRERFTSWYDTFCRKKINSRYNEGGKWDVIDQDRIYRLRCSLVHFFGLSSASEPIYLSLVSNNLPEKEIKDLEARLNKLKTNIIIKPHDFYILVKNGCIVMFNEWIKNIHEANDGDDNKKREHIEGIERIWKKIQNEGAIGIAKPMK